MEPLELLRYFLLGLTGAVAGRQLYRNFELLSRRLAPSERIVLDGQFSVMEGQLIFVPEEAEGTVHAYRTEGAIRKDGSNWTFVIKLTTGHMYDVTMHLDTGLLSARRIYAFCF